MTKTNNTPLYILLLLWFAGILAAGQFAKISVSFDTIREIYPSGGSAVGFLVSLISLIGMLFGLFTGMFVAKIGGRKMILFALILGGLMSIYQTSLPAIELFLMSRFIEGISHVAIVVAAPSMLAQMANPKYRNTILALWSTIFAMSFALFSWVLMPLLKNDIIALFWLHGLMMVALFVVFLLVLKPAGLKKNGARFSMAEIIDRHRAVYRSATLSAPALGWFFYTVTFVAFVTVLPDFMPKYERDFLGGILPLSAMTISLTLGVILLARISALNVVKLGFSIGIIGVLGFAFDILPLYSIILGFGAMGLVQAGSFSLVPQLNPEASDQALANGAMAQCGNAGNTVGTPLLLILVGSFGKVGLISFALLAFAGGIVVHLWCARRRLKALS